MNHSHPPLLASHALLTVALILSCVSCATNPPANGGDRKETKLASRLEEPVPHANPNLPAAMQPTGRQAVIAASSEVSVHSFEDDTFQLFALIESWPGRDANETGLLLTEEFIKIVQPRFPEVPKTRWNELASEFQPKIVAAFRSRTAAVCREHFSHEEVRQLIQFYETPVGRKYARAFTEIVGKMRAYDPQRKVVMDELVSRIRK